jgi:hypothetical protein
MESISCLGSLKPQNFCNTQSQSKQQAAHYFPVVIIKCSYRLSTYLGLRPPSQSYKSSLQDQANKASQLPKSSLHLQQLCKCSPDPNTESGEAFRRDRRGRQGSGRGCGKQLMGWEKSKKLLPWCNKDRLKSCYERVHR